MTRKNRATASYYSRILFFLFIVLVLIAAGCSSNIDVKNDAKNNVNPNPAAYEAKSSGSLQSGDVLIELAPAGIKNGKFEIAISANTHSIDLAQFDLMQQAVLQYGNKEIKPISTPMLNGHHSSGVITFDIKKEINNFKIIINNIPNMEKRVFEWP